MNIDSLVQSLIIEVPGCPLPTIRDMLRWAQRDLCVEGNVWIVSDGPAVVAANTRFAEVEAPTGAEVLRLMRLTLDGRDLVPGRDFKQSGGGGVEFIGVAPSSATLTGSVSCKPSYGKDMPGNLISRWSEAIMDGARYRLLSLPQPWRDTDRAEFHRRLFLDAQSHARQLAVDGVQHGSIRMRVRGFI